MQVWLDVNFGSGNTGLSPQFRFYNSDGADATGGARTGTGVVEVGGGAYGVLATVPDDAEGIEWDDGVPTLYAHEHLYERRIQFKLHKTAFNRRKWDKVADTVTVYDDDGTTPLYVFNTNTDLSEITPA